jgi:hypothetical protein
MKQTLTSLTVATAVSLAVAGTAVAQDDSGFSISGWINEGFAYYDDGNQSDVAQVSDNGTTLGSRITFAGFAELPNTGAKAGFEVIIEPQSLFTPLIFSNQDNFSDQNGGALGLLGSSAYIEGSAGKLTVGLQSMPTDNIAVLADPSLTLWSSISPLFRFNGFEIQGITDGGTSPVWGDFAECLTGDELQGAGGIGIDCNGIYRNGVRYDLPTFAEGLNIAAGYANSEIYDVAVKYNRDFGALTGIVHLGFAQNSGGTQYYRSANMFAFQGGLKHNDSGVYGTVAVQTEQANDLTAAAEAFGYGDNTTAWWAKAGVKRTIWGLGETHFGLWYGQYNDQFGNINETATSGMVTGSTLNRFGASIDQYFGSKLITYLAYENLTLDVEGTGGVDAAFGDADAINSIVFGMTFFF